MKNCLCMLFVIYRKHSWVLLQRLWHYFCGGTLGTFWVSWEAFKLHQMVVHLKRPLTNKVKMIVHQSLLTLSNKVKKKKNIVLYIPLMHNLQCYSSTSSCDPSKNWACLLLVTLCQSLSTAKGQSLLSVVFCNEQLLHSASCQQRTGARGRQAWQTVSEALAEKTLNVIACDCPDPSWASK